MAHILFVDDEPAIRETLSTILSSNGHTVVSSATVAEALGHIATERFDLLISDLNIGQPGDGFTVVSAMRRTNADCVNFILTGYPAFETALQAIREQVDEYLIKPASIPQLLKTIDERLTAKSLHDTRASKRLSMILRENVHLIVERSLAAMKQDPDLSPLTITDVQRVEGLPDALAELANVLDTGPEESKDAEVESSREHSEHQQVHPLRLIVKKERIIAQVIYKVFYENLLSLDLSHLMEDMAELNDTLLWQLSASIHFYLDAQHPSGPTQLKKRQSAASAPARGGAEQLDAIVDSAMDAIISLDARQRVVLFNRAAEQMFRCYAADALGKPLDQFVPGHLREVHRQHVNRFGATGVTSRSMRSPAPLTALRKTGEQFPIEATISQIGEGDQKRYTVILRDITYRTQTERALVQSEKLASIGRLATALAHEINNPLEGLKNLLYVISSDPTDADTVRKYSEMADTELNRVAEVTRQVLGLARGQEMPGLGSVRPKS